MSSNNKGALLLSKLAVVKANGFLSCLHNDEDMKSEQIINFAEPSENKRFSEYFLLLEK